MAEKKKSGWDAWREKAAQAAKEAATPKSSSTKKSSKKKTIKGKHLRRIHPAYILLAVVFFLLATAGGWYTASFMTKNDTFELVGNKTIIYYVGDTASYEDEGILCVSLGKDVSDNVTVNCDLPRGENGFSVDTSVEREIPITYTMESGRYKGKSVIRIIKVIIEDNTPDEPTEIIDDGGAE